MEVMQSWADASNSYILGWLKVKAFYCSNVVMLQLYISSIVKPNPSLIEEDLKGLTWKGWERTFLMYV